MGKSPGRDGGAKLARKLAKPKNRARLVKLLEDFLDRRAAMLSGKFDAAPRRLGGREAAC
ncbi:hypothetical protein [Nannocystis sp. SCPEA4]|uniref:hypothetical protein n=1 Tax=Nannocystis sp. SCPEA4 TaxID=2996787 RepID=UPI002270488D|nr:hypothetical protein [Nannocystis sp. SCPEA4]MCY1054940.1 hypothetical protein [Nannocystis sp. SCPEA4]